MKFDMPTCGGCRTCELACSFHHTGEFVPAVSSLKIIEKPEGPGYTVLLQEAGDGKSFACNRCKDLTVPLCVVYCRENDDLSKILQEFNAQNPEKESANLFQNGGV